MLRAQFTRCRVWTVHGTQCRQEWLLIRKDGHRHTYVLSNAALDTPLETMAWRQSHRYFIMLSVVNVRTLLIAAMSLPQLSGQEAAMLVIEHLINRTRSRKSRLRRQSIPP